MSTLVAQTISNGTVSTSSANVIQGSAKAWVNFNGSFTVSIRASYNVSSITDNGDGLYTVNFTNALSDANYCAVIGTSLSTANNGMITNLFTDNSTTIAPTTSGFRLMTALRSNGVPFDCAYLTAAVFR
jgi:hypothetical protein